ncbi:Ca2+/Na+ antiporter [Saccharothrix ecbatanensis]|uniref:Ca2+/Na+ antiporter n=1 Tax=Saccharothrix ecbatanensis TaxID=1105145 RepID=A0A7W9HVH0_9PSEU|nr:MAB_1171c family putative transporter [Saccharothrix ecbatanensis]MBB5808836.1 Ca2+/Na+ antiporter [Saccharothrix ecbatanensis]
MADLIFLPAAVGIALLGLYKYRALRHAPAERKATIRTVCLSCVFAAPSVLLGAPTVGIALDRVTGVNSLSVLLGFAFALGFVCSIQVMLVYWSHPPARAWRTSRWLVLTYSAIVAAIFVLFALGQRPEEHHHDFAAAYATAPYLAPLLILHFLAYVVGLANVVRLCWRWSLDPRTGDRPWLRRGLRITAIGILFPVAYGSITLVAVIGSWFGAELDVWSSQVAPAVAILGVPLVIVGNCIAAWGTGLTLLWDRITHFTGDLRDYRRLAVLWRALRCVEPEMVHEPASLANRISPRSRLFWRVIEINDWLHQLPAYRDPDVATAARAHANQARLGEQETLALVEAAQLKAALRARAQGSRTKVTAGAHHPDTAADAGLAFAGERQRLVLIARAFNNPLSNAVLDDTGRTG